ncbi:MAG: hypothetical protein LW686_06215 [Ilumatobacteraceae bacterium]|nr:hypothetical protein [Ilumatobacteraceae bacterium]
MSRFCGALALVFVATLITPGLSPAAQSSSLPPAQSDITIAMIVLDEAMLSPLLRTDGTINRKRFPGFATLADTSTWYRNMLGTSQRTTEAVPSILDGQWPSLKKYPILRDHPNNLFTYMQGKKDLNVYQSVTKLCPKGVCTNAGPLYLRLVDRQVQRFEEFIEASASSTTPALHFTHLLLPHRPWGLAPDLRIVGKHHGCGHCRPRHHFCARRVVSRQNQYQ